MAAPAQEAVSIRDIKHRARKHLWMPYTQLNDLIADDGPRVISRAEGSYLYDIEGNRYLDGVSALEAMVAGLELVTNKSTNATTHPPAKLV